MTQRTIFTAAGLAIAAAGGAVLAAATVGPDSIEFPAEYAKWQRYATVDRYDTKQVSTSPAMTSRGSHAAS